MTYEPTSFKKIAIDYVKDKIPDNEIILMGNTDITEETKQAIDGHTTTKRITIEWLEWKGENKKECSSCKSDNSLENCLGCIEYGHWELKGE